MSACICTHVIYICTYGIFSIRLYCSLCVYTLMNMLVCISQFGINSHTLTHIFPPTQQQVPFLIRCHWVRMSNVLYKLNEMSSFNRSKQMKWERIGSSAIVVVADAITEQQLLARDKILKKNFFSICAYMFPKIVLRIPSRSICFGSKINSSRSNKNKQQHNRRTMKKKYN